MVKSTQYGPLVGLRPIRQSVSPTFRSKEPITAVWNPRSQRRMRAGLVVMPDPLAKEGPQVPLAERYQIIQAFPSNRPHQPLVVGIGLRGTHRCSQHPQAQRPYLLVQGHREDAVAIVNQKPVCMVTGDGFP